MIVLGINYTSEEEYLGENQWVTLLSLLPAGDAFLVTFCIQLLTNHVSTSLLVSLLLLLFIIIIILSVWCIYQWQFQTCISVVSIIPTVCEFVINKVLIEQDQTCGTQLVMTENSTQLFPAPLRTSWDIGDYFLPNSYNLLMTPITVMGKHLMALSVLVQLVTGYRLDLMVLVVFFNLSDSGIL